MSGGKLTGQCDLDQPSNLSAGSVQEKISCVFESIVVEEPSTKRNYQPYKIVAVDQVRRSALTNKIAGARVTEKLDGTCVYIQTYKDIPWLWARHDRKPSKTADKKFKKFQSTVRAWQSVGEVGQKPIFEWDPEKDFKDIPADWMPASGVELSDSGVPLPDEGGHIFGWVPLDPRGRSHLWHASTVDLEAGVGLVLRPSVNDGFSSQTLEVCLVPLKDLLGSTMELIGTNINANPYRLGSKKQPCHLLIKHGSIPVETVPVDHKSFTEWFQQAEGQVEGVVWYCQNGQMYKLHRHHLHQKWPVEGITRLEASSVTVNIDLTAYNIEPDSPLYSWGLFNSRQFPSLKELSDAWVSVSG